MASVSARPIPRPVEVGPREWRYRVRRGKNTRRQRDEFSTYECSVCGVRYSTRVYAVETGRSNHCGCLTQERFLASRPVARVHGVCGRCGGPNDRNHHVCGDCARESWVRKDTHAGIRRAALGKIRYALHRRNSTAAMLAFAEGVLMEAYASKRFSTALARFFREVSGKMFWSESWRDRFYWGMTMLHVIAVAEGERVKGMDGDLEGGLKGMDRRGRAVLVRKLLREGYLSLDELDPHGAEPG